MIPDLRQGFEFSQLNSVLSWAFSRPRQDKKIKINGIITGSVTFEYYESYFNTWNILFSCIDSFHVVQNRVNQLKKKPYSWICEKHDQTSTDLTNVFDVTVQQIHVGMDEM